MRPISWKHVAIFACIFTPLGFVAWLIEILSSPAWWCGVSVGAAKVADQKPLVQDCTNILLALIDKLGTMSFMLVGAAVLGLLTWTVVGLRAKLSFHGPAGTGGEIAGDEDDKS